MWPLLGIAVVVAGFIARFNPLLVVVAAALVTGIAAALSTGVDGLHAVTGTIETFGKAFNDNRYITLTWMILPVIGLLERAGLQEKARDLIARVKGATTGRLLLLYLVVRQGTAAVGLTSLGGHPQMVRPLIAPMAEGAAEARHGDLSEKTREKIKAQSAATDNIGLFFGEDIFIAIASILLIKGFLETNGIIVEPFHLSVWAIPTAILALIIHGVRLWRLDAVIAREAPAPGSAPAAPTPEAEA
ncbi:MAG: DUF969 domain-containing protein [Caulobacter sp.]|nr:DUF969 domain-containing protein [Caulobacter sp.]